MGTITSGVGLMSGLNIDDIVSKLMSIERQPLVQLQARVKTVETERVAISDLSARILALKAAFAPLKGDLLFRSNKAVSSNQDLIQAMASSTAVAGSQRVRVEQLAATQQLVSRGVADADRTPLGSGTVVFASALSRLSQQTSLSQLNGQTGVTRGIIRVSDGSGSSAQVDLGTAKTVQDVVSAINTASGVQVRAEIRGDRLAIVDLSGQTTGPLTIADVNGGRAARDLGIAGTGTAGEILGGDVNTITEGTSLSLLNDGNGIAIDGLLDDMKITAADGTGFNVNLSGTLMATTRLDALNSGQGVRLGLIKITHSDKTSVEIDLTGAQTVGDVLSRLSTGGNVSATATSRGIVISDTIKGKEKLIIEDVTGGHAATDLGIAGSAAGSDTVAASLIGTSVYQIRTLGDVLRAINFATGNTGKVTASLDAAGKGLVLTDQTSGVASLAVEALGTSGAAKSLGLDGVPIGGVLEGRRLVATMNSTLLRSLNGGQGITQLGQVKIIDRAGAASTFDLSGAQSIDDVLSMLQAQAGGVQIKAELADSGLGIVIRDLSGGTGSLSVSDEIGTAAVDLKIAGSVAGETLRGGTLYRQFVSGNTLLSEMNYGKGIAVGKINITDSAGNMATFDVTKTATTTLRDLLRQFNNTNDKVNVEARINDSGDGIVIIDKAGGGGHLKIEDGGSSSASDLHIAGTTATGEDQIDGRLSQQILLGAGDSLNDLVEQLGKTSGLLSVGVINDGSSITPYRLMITAANSGMRGALAIDTGTLSLGLETLVQAQDAVAYIGGDGKTGGIRVVSSDNQIRNAIPGVTLTLTGKVGDYSDVTISRNTEGLTKQLSQIADKITDVLGRLDTLTNYDQESNTRGILLGDSAAWQVRQDLYSLLEDRVSVGGQSLNLGDLGLSISSSAAKFDEDKFHKKYDSNPEGIRKVFTDAKDGLWVKLDKIFAGLTDRGSGLLPSRSDSLQSKQDLFSKRADELTVLLGSKQKQLYAQYRAMESALAQLQTQQASLASIASLAASMKSGG